MLALTAAKCSAMLGRMSADDMPMPLLEKCQSQPICSPMHLSPRAFRTCPHAWLISSGRAAKVRGQGFLQPARTGPSFRLQARASITDSVVLGQSLPLGLPLLLYEALAAALFYLLIVGYKERARGWSNRDLIKARTCVHVQIFAVKLKQSHHQSVAVFQVGQSPVAGQGVFASVDLGEGQMLGAYPGVPRSANSMLRKASMAPNCKRYVFQSESNVWLDPTNSAGLLVNNPNFSIFSWSADASMAYVNEPPRGYAVNVEIVNGVNNLDIIFRAVCDIPAGSELFLDYGRTYDRSSYSD